jgi:hypothetical protein
MNEFKTQSGKYRSIDGRRIGMERRGVWHVQDVRNPSKAVFTGTLREIERSLHGRAVKMN